MHKCNFHDVAMPMMRSQILKSVDFQKHNNLDIIHKLYIKGYVIAKNSFIAEVTFK